MGESDMGMTSGQLDGVTSIAVIDDAFEPLSSIELPEQEMGAVLQILNSLDDQEILEEFDQCGIDQRILTEDPFSAIDALTSPALALGKAYSVLSEASVTLEKYIQDRHNMRGIAETMRTTSNCKVIELAPSDEIKVQDKQLVFIDYYLEKDKISGDRAVEIARQIEQEKDPECLQQIVLMSSREKVKSFRKAFREEAHIQGSMFSFVSKDDLDEPWKVRAHLEMFAGALPHSHVIGQYIELAKKNVRRAGTELIEVLDDLDLGDFAYIQKQSLQDDGHPLGDYLSWLFSNHLAALAFEHELREQQAKVDKIEFDKVFISPVEPSTKVAELYHNALFSRNVGKLGPHPRASDTDESHNVPLVGLGDVFLDGDKKKAVVILSADCDLAFAPNAEREPDRNMPVLFMMGTPYHIDDAQERGRDSVTEGMSYDCEVYRIDWKFMTYQTVPLGDLKDKLIEVGVDVSDRDRLRPLYAFKLQYDFGKWLLRPGDPVMPPFRKNVQCKILKSIDSVESVDGLEDLVLSLAVEENKKSIRITPNLAGQLHNALSDMCFELKERTENKQGNGNGLGGSEYLDHKIDAIERVLKKDEKWIDLLGDIELPKPKLCKELIKGIYLALGNQWEAPNDPVIILQVTDVGKE